MTLKTSVTQTQNAPEAKAGSARRNRKSPFVGTLMAKLGLHGTLIVLCLIWFVPVLALLVSSFRPARLVTSSGWWTVFSEPFVLTLRNYGQVLTTSGLGQSFVNSLLITIPVTLLTVMISAIAGYVFARWRFPGKDLIFLVLLILLTVPLQMTLVPVLKFFSAVSLVGTFPAVWIAHLGYALPFAIYLMRNFFAGLPDELFEAAAVDGASELRAFLRVALPLSAPALASVGVFEFMFVWNDLLVSLIFLGGSPDVAPLTVTVSNMVSARGEGWQLLTAAAFVLMALPMVVFFSLQKFFVRGLLAGSVK